MLVEADVDKYMSLGPEALSEMLQLVLGALTADSFDACNKQAYGLAARLLGAQEGRLSYARALTVWLKWIRGRLPHLVGCSGDHLISVQKGRDQALTLSGPKSLALHRALSSVLNLAGTGLKSNIWRANQCINMSILGRVNMLAGASDAWAPLLRSMMDMEGAAELLGAERALLPANDKESYEQLLRDVEALVAEPAF